MANLAASVMANQHAIDQNVLAEMNSQQSFWDYFGFVRGFCCNARASKERTDIQILL